MRVLHLTSMYPPNSNGGYELILESSVHHMREAGHQVRVLTTDLNVTGVSAPPGLQWEIHRELLSYWRPFHLPHYSLPAAHRIESHNHQMLRRHLDDFQPTVVGWWAMGGMSLSLMEAVRRAGLPAVSFIHDHWVVNGPGQDPWLRRFSGGIGARWAGRVAERATRIPTSVDLNRMGELAFVSQYMVRQAVEGGIDPRVARVLPGGVEEQFRRPTPLEPWRWQLMFVGRLDSRKGLATAIRALALLPEEATLRIVGSGGDPNYVAELEDLADDLGVTERVLFEGAVERHELPKIYASADVVIFPSEWQEPWGLVNLEVLGSGRPLIATGRGGTGEYLEDGRNCLLFTPKDAHQLAAAVRRLAEDEELLRHIVAEGINTAREHTQEKFNEGVLQYCLEAHAKAGAPDPN